MDKYSERITFKDNKDYYKSSKWKLIVAYILLAALIISIAWTGLYNIYNRPTVITEEEVYGLLVENEIVKKSAFEEAKKTIEYEPNDVGGLFVMNIEKVDNGVLDVEISNTVNYPGAYFNLFGTATLKYKKGWYVDKVNYTNNLGLQPWFTAGETFLSTLNRDIYGQGYFEFDEVKNSFPPTYVDSLCVMSEEGDFESTKIEVAPYNQDGRVDIEATLKYNFDTWEWEIISFDRVGTR